MHLILAVSLWAATSAPQIAGLVLFAERHPGVPVRAAVTALRQASPATRDSVWTIVSQAHRDLARWR